MAARILTVADGFATQLQTFLTATTPGVTVERAYVPDVDDDDFDTWLASSTSMRAFVVPVRKQSAVYTRGNDQLDYTFMVIFVERYNGTGTPTNAWMDARVNLVDSAEEYFGDTRNVLTITNAVWAVESELSIIFDADLMIENGAFWAAWKIVLREIQ